MLLLSIFGLIVGVILGTRFRVLVLVPVIFFAATTIIAASVAKGFGVGMTLVALLTLLASVEFGYLAGCLGAGYLFRRVNLRRIAASPADGIALAILATAIILFAVFYELNSSYHTEPTAAAFWRVGSALFNDGCGVCGGQAVRSLCTKSGTLNSFAIDG